MLCPGIGLVFEKQGPQLLASSVAAAGGRVAGTVGHGRKNRSTLAQPQVDWRLVSQDRQYVSLLSLRVDIAGLPHPIIIS